MEKKNSNKNKNNGHKKTLWHPYKLQSLTPEKFVDTVQKILKGEYELLSQLPDKRD